MMTSLAKSTAVALALTGLAACGGGGGGGGGNTTPPPDYVDFANTTLSVDSTLEGQLLITEPGAVEIRALDGSLRHDTRALTGLTDGIRTLDDQDGDDSGTWTDGTLTLAPDGSVLTFAQFYSFIDPSGDSGTVVIGVTIDAADVPTTNTTGGGVTYSGEARIFGSADPGGAATPLSSTGTATVVVDFAGNDVSLTVDNLSSGLPYDLLTITGMTIDAGDRSSFGGGSLQLFDGMSDETAAILGTNITGDAQGDFFGQDSNDNPDEVGGVFAAEGDGGEIFGGFLAD